MKTRTRRFLKIGIVAFLTAMSALLAGVGFLYGRYIHGEPLPPLSIFEDNAVFENFPFSARIFAKDQIGGEFVEVQVGENYLNERRYYIAKKDLPKLKTLTGAILATEDRHFYAHPGVNPFALLHAAIDHYLFGKQRRGASTISQQLVKNILRKLGLIDMSERGTKQKIQEIYLTIRLEQYLALKFGSKRAAKEHLLWLYLNTIPMGRVNGGFAAAAYDYFGVTPEMLDTLTAEQALVLAALPKGPEKYLAAFNPASANYSVAHKALNDRMRYAAEGMRKSGTMTPDVFKRIKDTPFTYTPPPPRIRDCNEFVTEVRQSLSQNAELLRGFEPLEIYTTCVVPWQRAARQAVKERSEYLDAHNGDDLGEPQGAAVFMETNGDDRGAVSVLIGNKDPFPIGTFNRALAARRAAGSTFKAPVYYLLMRDGLTPNSSVSTARVCLPPFQRGLPYWCPKNAHPTSLAVASAEESLTRSINTATARFAQKLNNRHGEPRYVVREMIKLMVDTGIPREALDFQPSLPLGPSSVTALELTQLYATLTHDGKHVKPFLVESCREKHSNRSCQLGEIMRREERQVADPKAAGLLTRMLISASRPGGTVSSVGQALNDEEAAVKSGTSQSNKNAWVVGGTKDIAGAVWYGFDDESSGLGTDEKGKEWQGGRTAGPVWAKIARAMLEGRGRQRFVAPPGIAVVHFVKERLRLEDGSEAIGIRCAKEEEQAKGKFSYTEWYPEEKRPRCIGYLSKRIIPPPLTPASVVPATPTKSQQPAQPLTRTQVKTG